MLNRYWIVASVERKVLSSYGWCSHFVGEPVTYAIFKDRRGVNPLSELKRRPAETVYGRLPSLNAHPLFIPRRVGARSDNTDAP